MKCECVTPKCECSKDPNSAYERFLRDGKPVRLCLDCVLDSDKKILGEIIISEFDQAQKVDKPNRSLNVAACIATAADGDEERYMTVYSVDDREWKRGRGPRFIPYLTIDAATMRLLVEAWTHPERDE